MTLTVSSISPRTGNELTVDSNTQLEIPGSIIQTVYVRSDAFEDLTAPGTPTDGINIPSLRITMTPKRSDSWIWLRWTVHYEMHHDTNFVVKEDDVLIGTNTDAGGNRRGILTPQYDNNYDSTPQVNTINWFVKAGSTTSRYYDLCVKSSNATARSFTLNRSTRGGDERGISYAFVKEICG